MRRGRWILLALATTLVHGASAQRRIAATLDTVFIIPGSHLDIGFTAPINDVRRERIAILDRAIDLATRDPHFVWFEEGGWSVEAWLDQYHHDPARIARLRDLVVHHRIGIGATLLSPHAAAFPAALHLLTMHLDRVQQELGVRPSVAVINDVPAIPEAMIDALATHGIHYLLMGPNFNFTPPLPAAMTRDPFYWESSRGNRVLVAIDPKGYGDALTNWLLPPDCIRHLDPQEFPASLSDDSILTLGVARQLSAWAGHEPFGIIQHSSDNGSPDCAATLDAAAVRWNRRRGVPRLVITTPEQYFHDLEARVGSQLAVRRGEWGGDWDLLRASEPVWSWRLRKAIAALTPASSRELLLAAATVTDHNIGLGPRWMDGVPEQVAEAHVAQVAELYRTVVRGALGERGLTMVPPAIAAPPAGPWPDAWRQIVGDQRDAARVRAGVSFIYPLVPPDAPAMPTPVTVRADAQRLVIHTAIDRVALEQAIGPRYQAVIDITLRAPPASVRLAPRNSPAARAGHWLTGMPDPRVVAPDGVVVNGPQWSIEASGPLIIGWTLAADAHDPSITHLQALAVVHAVEGTVAGGQHVRGRFDQMYPGEPPTPVFDLELHRLPK
ncbi:MAG TPA: hypothetical protein VGM20_07440 [Gemmatimonadales bacterium]